MAKMEFRPRVEENGMMLRQWTAEDFEFYAAYLGNEATAQYIGGVTDTPKALDSSGIWGLRRRTACQRAITRLRRSVGATRLAMPGIRLLVYSRCLHQRACGARYAIGTCSSEHRIPPRNYHELHSPAKPSGDRSDRRIWSDAPRRRTPVGFRAAYPCFVSHITCLIQSGFS
jgi:hypothetical protein